MGVDLAIDINSVSDVKKVLDNDPIIHIHNSDQLKKQDQILLTPIAQKVFDIVKNVTDINDLKNKFKNFDGCNLKKTASNFVSFEGDEKSNLMIIDGPPGSNEDKEGKVFTGEKGVLLKKMLKAIGLEISDTFITNIIPWRPPGNRYPSTEELIICKPYIMKLISLVNPKIILCMGEVATNQILNLNQSIIDSRGKWNYLEIPTIYNEVNPIKKLLLATFNVSHLLRRTELKKEAWEDMKILRDKLVEIIK